MLRRLAAPLTLFFLAPLIAEYLLGSLPMSMIVLLPLMAAMYGSAAILIREVVRHTDHGWPSIVLLAIAYGLFEEGLVTQSLFNPNYLHLHLLRFGWLPALGTALPWLVFVVSIHVAWSICVPIGFIEVLFPRQGRTPWLKTIGMLGFAFLLLVGSGLVAIFSYKQVPFLASPMQFGIVVALIVALIGVALAWPTSTRPANAKAPRPLVLLSASFVAGSTLQLLKHFGPLWHLSWPVVVAAALAIEAAFVVFMVVFTRGRTWNDVQRWALMCGALLVYVWCGFGVDGTLHDTASLAAHSILAIAIVMLAAFAGIRARRSEAQQMNFRKKTANAALKPEPL